MRHLDSRRAIAALSAIGLAVTALAMTPRVLVICAPGYPGDTVQAQATMDSFAAKVTSDAGWPAGALSAVYFENAEGGAEKLRQGDAAVALLTLPFFLQNESTLGLRPRLQAVQASGATEVWSLIAKKGSVASPSSLEGWEIVGLPGYVPDFVRGPILGAWGKLPAAAKIRYSRTTLTALRKAAAGEKIAVLLDPAGVDGLSALPFAGDLEIVHRSKPVPSNVLCTVGKRLPEEEAAKLLEVLQRLDATPEGAEVLRSLRLVRFEPLDVVALEAARRAMPPA